MGWFSKKESPEERLLYAKEGSKEVKEDEYKQLQQKAYESEKHKQLRSKAEYEGKEKARKEYGFEKPKPFKPSKQGANQFGNLFDFGGAGMGGGSLGEVFGEIGTDITAFGQQRQPTKRIHHHKKKHHHRRQSRPKTANFNQLPSFNQGIWR